MFMLPIASFVVHPVNCASFVYRRIEADDTDLGIAETSIWDVTYDPEEFIPMSGGLNHFSPCLRGLPQCYSGWSSTCLLYDRSDVSLKLHGLAAAVKFGATVAFSIGWYKIRRLNIPLTDDS
ncbi:hypothetical protein CAPTEDRAFT_194207 [Capitella teleta]|uniref:Uncharacterized protein n=1 Tax=Capitella teleta TaxID=283909 RepID=R7T9Y3_CAPTE|nr:hypothetical protein CAPTEDRAFT_194207 [Capitella teleta]|eukprot:ELT87819.1 hypothetical protein CAPTEDRAFT_194207 [Capitella teleta]